jgi:hypothetical protein
MKKLIDILYRGLFLSCLVILFTCSDDAAPDPGDPNDFCSVELCSSDGILKQVCIDEYNDCVAAGLKTKTECAAFAAETCTI